MTLAALAVGCSAPAADDAESSACLLRQPIINGTEAPGGQLNAIGNIGVRDDAGMFHALCSGTLVAPDLVLTAKHCTLRSNGERLVASERVVFSIGANSQSPLEVADAVASDVSEPEFGGVAELGSDVGIYKLQQPVQGVSPLPIATWAPSDESIGVEVQAFGYGTDVGGCNRDAPFLAARRKGSQVVAAVRGNLFDKIYGDYDTYLNDALLDHDAVSAQWRYSRGFLLEGYEIWIRGVDGAQTCSGDSGGPIVLNQNGRMAIIGVVSWSWRSASEHCAYGSVVAVFGPETLLFLHEVTGFYL